jgi:hypothetical protein
MQHVVTGAREEQTTILARWTPIGLSLTQMDHGRIGCCGVLRGSDGECLVGFAERIGMGSVYLAEF